MRTMRFRTSFRLRGFTLIELMVVVALAVILLALAAPSFREMILMQRLRSTAAQVVTDMQFARSEAASRQRNVYIDFNGSAAGMSCYIVHTCSTANPCSCNCAAAEGSRCGGTAVDLRTAQVQTDLGIKVNTVATPSHAAVERIFFDPATGSMRQQNPDPVITPPPVLGEAWIETSIIGGAKIVRTVVAESGRPSNCSPSSTVSSVTACP